MIPAVTDEESQMVKDYILLPVLLDVLERDIKTAESVEFKMGSIYVQHLRNIQDKVTHDITELRKTFRQSGIRVYEQKRTSKNLETKYLCRGYHYEITLLWTMVKADLEIRLAKYLGVKLE